MGENLDIVRSMGPLRILTGIVLMPVTLVQYAIASRAAQHPTKRDERRHRADATAHRYGPTWCGAWSPQYGAIHSQGSKGALVRASCTCGHLDRVSILVVLPGGLRGA